MHFFHRKTTSTRIAETILAGLFTFSLILFAAGCGGAGTNGGDNGDGDGNGDGNGNDDGTDTTAPGAPTGLSADAQPAAVELSWESVDEADTYRVYRSTSSTDGVSGSALNTGISEASYTDGDAENGTTYYYRVTAVDAADNESDGSGEVQSTPFATPSELSGTSGNSQIELSWSAAAGAESYSIYRSTSSTDGATGEPLTTGVSETVYTDSTAENGTTYYYRVTAVNPEEEESSASNEVEKTPFDDPPDRP